MKKYIILLLLIISCTISPVFAAPQESMEEKSLETHYNEAIEKIREIAYQEIGYLEKKSNKNLDSPMENAGFANYTKFADDLNNWNFYTTNLNGQPWCDMFVDWCFCTTFGVSDAKIITYQNPYGSAACVSSMEFYKSVGQFYKEPQLGDQIFFRNGKYGSNHTGFVYKIDENTVYTIEGNTSSDSGVVANGGAVRLKSYNINSKKIAGYGRPNYMLIATQNKIKYDNEKIQKREDLILAKIDNNMFELQPFFKFNKPLKYTV